MSKSTCSVKPTSNLLLDRLPSYFTWGKPRVRTLEPRLITIAEKRKKEPSPEDYQMAVKMKAVTGTFKYNATTCEYNLKGKLSLKPGQNESILNLQIVFTRGQEN
jgi:hypothetical protein